MKNEKKLYVLLVRPYENYPETEFYYNAAHVTKGGKVPSKKEEFFPTTITPSCIIEEGDAFNVISDYKKRYRGRPYSLRNYVHVVTDAPK